MSTARLNVWVTALGRPCRIDNEHQWFVHVLHCDGEILTWCDRRFTNIPTKCGQAEIDVPPGCYVIAATWSPGTSSQFLGNHLTHQAIVQVRCGDHACVNLFNPTLHHCGTWFLQGVRDAAAAGRLDREVAARAEEAIQAVLQQDRLDPFTERTQNLGRDAGGEQPLQTQEVQDQRPNQGQGKGQDKR